MPTSVSPNPQTLKFWVVFCISSGLSAHPITASTCCRYLVSLQIIYLLTCFEFLRESVWDHRSERCRVSQDISLNGQSEMDLFLPFLYRMHFGPSVSQIKKNFTCFTKFKMMSQSGKS